MYVWGVFALVGEHRAGTGHGAEGREHGVAFYGSEGTLVVDGTGWEVYPETQKKGQTKPPIAVVKKKIEEDPEQCRISLVNNLLDCVKTRKRPIMDIERGYHVTAVAHLGNLALRTGRSIQYDAENLKVGGNDQANRMIANPYRAPWALPRL